MSDETFPVTLAGKTWALPHLPFRLVKKIQPTLFHIYREAGGDGISLTTVALLTEEHYDALADAMWTAVNFVDPAMSRDAFFDLPFSVGELLVGFPSLARSAGLRATPVATEAAGGGAAGE
jgi:hypothetical protein